jgi:hypothetical protein
MVVIHLPVGRMEQCCNWIVDVVSVDGGVMYGKPAHGQYTIPPGRLAANVRLAKMKKSRSIKKKPHYVAFSLCVCFLWTFIANDDVRYAPFYF